MDTERELRRRAWHENEQTLKRLDGYRERTEKESLA